jgi:hypothetical protein
MNLAQRHTLRAGIDIIKRREQRRQSLADRITIAAILILILTAYAVVNDDPPDNNTRPHPAVATASRQ